MTDERHSLMAALEMLVGQIERTRNNSKRRRLRAELARTVAKVERRAEVAEMRQRTASTLTLMHPPVAPDAAPLVAGALLTAPRSRGREDMAWAWAISEHQRRFLHPQDPDARTEELSR